MDGEYQSVLCETCGAFFDDHPFCEVCGCLVGRGHIGGRTSPCRDCNAIINRRVNERCRGQKESPESKRKNKRR